MKIIYLSSFPPRECGIATFTADLTDAMDDLLEPVIESRIAAVNTDAVSRYHYPRHVLFQIDPHSERDYVRTAESINGMDDVKLVNVQHEFGLFGGPYGSNILSFLGALKKPSVVTFHSVLPSPNSMEARRLIVDEDNEKDDPNLNECAKRIIQLGCEYVLITGTHEHTPKVINNLYGERGLVRSDNWPRLPGIYHGSGCTLAAAIAALLANGLPMEEAVREAQEYTWEALKYGFRPGMGQHIPDRLFWARDEDEDESETRH